MIINRIARKELSAHATANYIFPVQFYCSNFLCNKTFIFFARSKEFITTYKCHVCDVVSLFQWNGKIKTS